MTEAFIQVSGNAELVRQGLQNFDADIVKIGRRTIYNTSVRIKNRLRIYPPERPDQTYVRTFALRDSVRVTGLPSGYVISVNPISPKGVAYGGYVVGDADGNGQAWMHKDRWPQFANVALEEIYTLPDEIVNELELSAENNGLEFKK